MNNAALRDYFQKARSDPAARAQRLAHARHARALFGGIAVVAAVAGGLQAALALMHGGGWSLRPAPLFIVTAAIYTHLWDKYGDRVAILESMGEAVDDATASPPPAPGTLAPARPS